MLSLSCEAYVRQSVFLPSWQPVQASCLPVHAWSWSQFSSPLSSHLCGSPCDFLLVPGPGTLGSRISFVAVFSGVGLTFLNLRIYQRSPHSPPSFSSWKPFFQAETFNLNYSHTTGNTQKRTGREILST